MKRESGVIPLDMGQEIRLVAEDAAVTARLVAEDAAVTADEMGKVVEDATVPYQDLCQVRYQKSGPLRTSKEKCSPLALETRAWMKRCSALPWRRWLGT